MIADRLRRLLDPRPLSSAEARALFDRLVDDRTSDAERGEILVALAARPSRTEELVAFARAMRRRARPFPVPARDRAIDLCGSGGARRPSYNVSTVSAFVVRAAGLPVAKHGNRSRGLCGSSDLLAALGLPVTSTPEFASASYRRYGIAFLHAPLFHPATAAVATARRQLGIPTIFNRLGPLSNPAELRCQVSGTVDVPAAIGTAAALRALGVRRGITMTSDDGCDEFSPRAPTSMVHWDGTRVRRLRLDPQRFLPPEDRRGSWGALPPPAAAEQAERLLAGSGGARRGAVLLTSGAALWVAGRSRDLGSGVVAAERALDGGGAERILEQLRELAGRFPKPEEA
ncbi:MAG TPA: anthranilate phosphoribosyltransferase [Thermoplasmata archaeon]|nr:anthranilate phosphoribosyltransferase [Thermoplasmata archaeon]